jgi:DNA-directed RNA polymerase subunit L
MVKRGLEILKQKVMAIEAKTVVEVIHQETNLYALNVANEDHTMGNMLQVSMYNNYVRKNKIIDFVGYFQPHPLDPNIIFKIRFFDDMDDVKRFLNEALRLTAAGLTEIHDEWTKQLTITVASIKKVKPSTKKTTVK